jgi:hypothetical protein
VTFGYNPDTSTFGDNSVLGEYGAFPSRESDDIGSPGLIRTPSEPRILHFVRFNENDYQLTWYGLSNRFFGIEYKDDFSEGWNSLLSVMSTGPVTTAIVTPGGSLIGRRFLRMSLQP